MDQAGIRPCFAQAPACVPWPVPDRAVMPVLTRMPRRVIRRTSRPAVARACDRAIVVLANVVGFMACRWFSPLHASAGCGLWRGAAVQALKRHSDSDQ